MSKYRETVLTDSGLDLASRAANGKTKFTITKATATEDDLSTMSNEDLQKLVTLPNEVQTGSITNQAENIKNSKSVVGTEILFTNEHIDKGYKVNSVGLYAKEDGRDAEILYALNTAIEPEYMPDFADQVLMQFKITMYVIVGRTENVTVKVDPTNMASKEYVDTKVSEIDVNDEIENSVIYNRLQSKLAYADNLSKGNNKLTQVAEAAGLAPMGLKQINDKGEITPFMPDPKDGLIDISGLGSIGGDSGGSVDPDHPSAGVDIYPGSLKKGEITERYCLWQGESDPTATTNVTFSQDVGSKMDKVGEGLTFLFHIKRTTITKGVKGESVDIEFNYDPNNISKDGYFTTTAPVPAYIKAGNLKPDEEQIITFNGVGEGLTTIKNHLSPGIGLTFKSDKSMDIRPIQGYDNDGASDGITGYIYFVITEVVATYSTQSAVQQLPATINFFTGLSNGSIALSGASNFYENSLNGIQITRANTFQTHNSEAIQGDSTAGTPIGLNLPGIFNIPKEKLIIGYRFPIPTEELPKVTKTQSAPTAADADSILDPKGGIGSGSYLRGINNAYIELMSGKINTTFSIQLGWWIYNGNPKRWSNITYKMMVNKITPYQE